MADSSTFPPFSFQLADHELHAAVSKHRTDNRQVAHDRVLGHSQDDPQHSGRLVGKPEVIPQRRTKPKNWGDANDAWLGI
jgi:hypothetical protein